MYNVKYSRHYGTYMAQFENATEAVQFAMHLTEEGEGYVKGIYREDGSRAMSLNDVWDFIFKKWDEEEKELDGYDGVHRGSIRG